MSEKDKDFLDGLEVTIKLVMYKTEEDPENPGNLREVADAQPEVIRVYKCRYTVTGSGTNEDPWVLTCEEVK